MVELQVDSLLEAAAKNTGLSDFGDDSFRPQFTALIDALNRDGKLTDVGLKQTVGEMAGLLANRLRNADWLNRYPEIQDVNIESPVFATGLPRSGTTFLLYLFDHDDRFQLLRTWECDSPCPPPGYAPETIQPRIERAQAFMAAAWKKSVPDFDAIHLMDVEGPDECARLLNNDFNQVGFLNYLNVPSYFEWIMKNADFVSTYRYHKLQLQLLQWRRPDKRWVLKYPNHLLGLEAIRAVHPKAKFIITHRDPVKTLASLCNLTHSFRGARSEQQNKHQIGKQLLFFIKQHVDALLSYRRDNSGTFIDVDYYALVDNPLEVMKGVYSFLDLAMPSTVTDSLSQWIKDNPKGKRGAHSYSLEDYGLERGEVEEVFAEYRSLLNIPHEL